MVERAKFPDWSGRTAVVIASGPSLTAEDCQTAEIGTFTTSLIAVNASFRMAPTADVVYMGDYQAVKLYAAEVARTTWGVKGKGSKLWTCTRLGAEQHQANFVEGRNEVGLGKTCVNLNGNSGFQAINLAYLFGARKIILLGFDMKPRADGRRHWHDEHPRPLVQVSQFEEWIHKSHALAADLEDADVDVVNCSRETALTCFRRGDLKEELACPARC